jgi:hypothetical protein
METVMSREDLDYYDRRARQERSAAKAAKSLPARRIHQELALRYSLLITASEGMAAAA